MRSLAAFALVCLAALGGCAANQVQSDRCASGGGCVTLTRAELMKVLDHAATLGAKAMLEHVAENGCPRGGI